MKKYLKHIEILGILLFCFTSLVIARSTTSTKRARTLKNQVIKYPNPNQTECNTDIYYCFNRYCFYPKTLGSGVYYKCGAIPASTIITNVEPCLKTRAVIKKLDLEKGCKAYTYNRILYLLANKDTIEQGRKQNTPECSYAAKMLQAAKQCYAVMISSDGSYSSDLYNKLEELCGESVSGEKDMASRFFKAGDYGSSDLQSIKTLALSGQNTMKRENWRQIVDATLAGYTEIAEQECGKENYELTKINNFALDSRDNLAMIQMKEAAKQSGKALGDRIIGSIYKESDCKNSPLPEGGLYWRYVKGQNPDCRIVCKEGFVIANNNQMNKCVPIKPEKDLGLNLGPHKDTTIRTERTIEITGGDYKEKPTIEKQQPNKPIKDCDNVHSDKAYTNLCKGVDSNKCNLIKTCNRMICNNQLDFIDITEDEVCGTFKNDSGNWLNYVNAKIGDVENITEDGICISSESNSRLTNYNLVKYVKYSKIFKLFGDSETKYMGDNYNEGLSKNIKNYCDNTSSGGVVQTKKNGSTVTAKNPTPPPPKDQTCQSFATTSKNALITSKESICSFIQNLNDKLEVSTSDDKKYLCYKKDKSFINFMKLNEFLDLSTTKKMENLAKDYSNIFSEIKNNCSIKYNYNKENSDKNKQICNNLIVKNNYNNRIKNINEICIKFYIDKKIYYKHKGKYYMCIPDSSKFFELDNLTVKLFKNQQQISYTCQSTRQMYYNNCLNSLTNYNYDFCFKKWYNTAGVFAKYSLNELTTCLKKVSGQIQDTCVIKELVNECFKDNIHDLTFIASDEDDYNFYSNREHKVTSKRLNNHKWVNTVSKTITCVKNFKI